VTPTFANRAAFALAVAASLVVLFLPGSDVPGGPPYSDKLVHAALFGLVALTGLRARVPLVPLALTLVAYAAVSEVLQATLPIGRDGDVWDFVADSVGTGLGLAAGVRRAARRD
jgi:hypothetical protein